MIMNLKRLLISTMLIVVVVVTALTGCNNSAQVSNEDVEVVTIWSSGAGVNVEAAIAQEFNETIGKEKGIKIDYQPKEGDVNQQIGIALQSGTAPDIFGGGKIKEYSEKGYIAPISAFEGGKEFVENSVAHGGAFVENSNVVNGEAYAVTNSVITFGLIYNKDMFKAAGIVDENGEPTPPETWDEFREYAKRLTDKSKRQYGVIFPMKWGGWYDYDVFRGSFSASPNFCFDTETMQYDYSELNGVLNTIMGIKEDGSCYPGSEGIDNDPARARFAEGNIGMKVSISWDVGVFKEQFPAKCDWGVAPLPTYSKDEKYLQYLQKNNGPYINANVLDTPREEAVFEVWKFWNGNEKAIKLYKEGIQLPTEYKLVEDIEVDIKGWAEFASLQEISASAPLKFDTVISGKKTLKELFINDVWNGTMTVEEATAQFTETANEGIKQYYEQNPSADMEKILQQRKTNPELFENAQR